MPNGKKGGKFKIWYLILAVHVRFFREVLFNAKILSLVTQPFVSKPVLSAERLEIAAFWHENCKDSKETIVIQHRTTTEYERLKDKQILKGTTQNVLLQWKATSMIDLK